MWASRKHVSGGLTSGAGKVQPTRAGNLKLAIGFDITHAHNYSRRHPDGATWRQCLLVNGITEVGEEREKAHEYGPGPRQAFVMSWHQGPGESSDTYLIEPPLALLITVLHCMSPCLAVAFKVSKH